MRLITDNQTVWISNCADVQSDLELYCQHMAYAPCGRIRISDSFKMINCISFALIKLLDPDFNTFKDKDLYVEKTKVKISKYPIKT